MMRPFLTHFSIIWILILMSVSSSARAGWMDDIAKSQKSILSKSVGKFIEAQAVVVSDAESTAETASSSEEQIEANLAILKSKDDLEILVETQQVLQTGTPPPPEKLRQIEEVIRWASRKVWVMCQGQPWMSPEIGAEYGPLIDSHRSKVKSLSLAIGRVAAFDRYGDGNTQLRANIGTAIAIGPNHILTNKHVIISGRLGYEEVLNTGNMNLYSNVVGKISFPVEYERCDPTRRATTSNVDILAIEYAHPDLDFVIARVDGNLTNSVNFPVTRDHVVGSRIAVIGYTSRPGDRETFLSPVQIDNVFSAPDGRTPFPVQRLAEGFSIVNDGVEPGYFRYDATTWGGNSGSLVIDLSTGSIIGLHSRGLQSNDRGSGYNEAIRSDLVANAISALSN